MAQVGRRSQRHLRAADIDIPRGMLSSMTADVVHDILAQLARDGYVGEK